jgi:hypothetical protein
MIYGKLIGGALHGAPRPIRTENGDVFTTDPNLLLQYGYKPIILTEYPSDGKSYIDSWAETETEITQVWTEVQQSDDDPISDSEALEIITGGADA